MGHFELEWSWQELVYWVCPSLSAVTGIITWWIFEVYKLISGINARWRKCGSSCFGDGLGNHNHRANPHVHQQHIVWATTFRSGLPQPLSSQTDLIKAGATQTETSLLKQYVAGERVDLLDDCGSSCSCSRLDSASGYREVHCQQCAVSLCCHGYVHTSIDIPLTLWSNILHCDFFFCCCSLVSLQQSSFELSFCNQALSLQLIVAFFFSWNCFVHCLRVSSSVHELFHLCFPPSYKKKTCRYLRYCLAELRAGFWSRT